MRTLALTLARAQPARAAVGACVHAGQGEAEPAFPRPLLSSLSSLYVGELYIYRSTPFRARTLKLPGLTVVRFQVRLSKFFPTFNSGAQDQGLPALLASAAPPPQVRFFHSIA